MQSCIETEIERFARWAAIQNSAATVREHINSRSQSKSDENGNEHHPFLGEMERYRQSQLRRYYVQRHFYRQRLRMQRSCMRASRRRGRPVTALFHRAGFSRWRSPAELSAVRSALKPEGHWRKVPAIAGEVRRRLWADLAAIDRELEIQGMEPARVDGQGRLTWEVHIADCQGYDLGVFQVRFHVDGQVIVSGGDFVSDGYCHPHVSRDGSLCTGRFGAMREWLYQDGALELVFSTINHILRTYNPDSPYIELDRLMGEEPGDECGRCGARIATDESYGIDGEIYCSECCQWCDGCEEYVSIEQRGETFGDYWYCSACAEILLEHCENCGAGLPRTEAIDAADGGIYCADCVEECRGCQKPCLKTQIHLGGAAEDDSDPLCPQCAGEDASRTRMK